MKAKSIKGLTPGEIQSALHQSMADGFRPTLAFVFMSIKQDRNAICEILHRADIDILGATSCGEFIDGYQGEGSIAMLLLDIPHEAYAVRFEDLSHQTIDIASTQIAQSAFQKFKNPALIVCSTGTNRQGEIFPGDRLLRTMEKAMGKPVLIYGGMAGDDGTFTGSCVFTYSQSSDMGVAALVLDHDRISLMGMAISGWKPLGITRSVTKSEGGWIYTIDDQPALDMYLRYLGKDPDPGEDPYRLFEEVGVHFPFQVEGIDDPVMRTPFMVNRDTGALKLDFDVPQGTKLRFSMPPDFDIVENVLEQATDLKEVSQFDAEALLIFSCAGRLSALGPMTNMENEGLSEIWKSPMAGFFTYGEYGTNSHGRQEFHSTTCCWGR